MNYGSLDDRRKNSTNFIDGPYDPCSITAGAQKGLPRPRPYGPLPLTPPPRTNPPLPLPVAGGSSLLTASATLPRLFH
jgi:hypothetical protein